LLVGGGAVRPRARRNKAKTKRFPVNGLGIVTRTLAHSQNIVLEVEIVYTGLMGDRRSIKKE
jgi:hypothetical protein